MKIVAVIPARANSKRIPNKNIRLLNNRPMIYYAIRNALESKFITDIVVTTDSQQIEIIAQQMGVKCHMRSPELCADHTTLDEVVYDALQGRTYDYVVTMQPTSPTLTVKTLDDAIEHCIQEGLDTVISGYNRPRLTWRVENGKKVPAYTERLNSQYLPACFYETGAFLICKGSIASATTRIGSRVDIFEVPRDEAVNVDTFQDLALANIVLQQKRVGIYVNGNNTRGIGHVYRALELADEFYSRPDIYFDLNQTDPAVFGHTDHNLIPVDGLNELLPRIQEKDYDIFINDILSTSIDYMIALRKCLPHARIINFEDDGEGVYKADLVFNALYQNINLPHVKVGEQYYIASKLFSFYEPIKIREKVSDVFISFGGADPQNYTDRLLEIVKNEKYRAYRFHVVIGRAKLNAAALLEYNRVPNIEVLYDINDMPRVMSQCDIAVTSRGRTGYELAVLGVPTIAMAQNHREEKHGFICHENGFNYLGMDPSDTIIESNLDMYLALPAKERQRYQNIMLSKDLRRGKQRVMSLINSL